MRDKVHRWTRLTRWAPLFAVVSLCGCLQVQDELTLRPDGSGNVKLTLRSTLPEDLIDSLRARRDAGPDTLLYPPTSEDEARRFFPGPQFTWKVDQSGTDDATTLVIEAAFKDINALLASPYGNAHQLRVQTNAAGALQLQALSGGSPLAQAAQLKTEGDLAPTELPGIQDAAAKKRQLRFQFRVTLPNPISTANRPHDNQSLTWTVERAQCKDDAEFAARLAGVLEATCSRAGIRFSATNPARLGLFGYDQLAAGKLPQTSPSPQTNQLGTAAQFVPYMLHLTRTRRLEGTNFTGGGQAELIGAMLLHGVPAPHRWGPVTLDEVIDDQGNSLLNLDGDARSKKGILESFVISAGGESENETVHGLPARAHLLALRFNAPRWPAKEIAKIKGRLSLEYLGEAEVIKLSHAVPPALIANPGRLASPNDNSPPESQSITDRRLAELGLSLRVETAAVQNGMTTLALEAGGSNVFLLDAQLFDADSQPWPTWLSLPEQDSWELRVVGRPKPPCSLALTLSKPGPTITVPILLEHLNSAQPKGESIRPNESELTPGFLAEPVNVTVSTVQYFPAGETFLKDRSAASLLGPMTTGTVISAKLFPPKNRILRSVTAVQVTSANDDQGRSIPLVTGTGTQRLSVPANSDDSEPGSPLHVELRLGVPAGDAKAIEDLTAEATILSIGGWKEMSLTNVLADPKTPIDLSQILPGTKLVIKRVGKGRRERTVEANLDGPAAIDQLVLKIKPTGPGPAQSRFRGWRLRRGKDSKTATTRDILVRSLEPQMSEEGRNSPLTLLIRLPQDEKREHVQFKLKPFGLL